MRRAKKQPPLRRQKGSTVRRKNVIVLTTSRKGKVEKIIRRVGTPIFIVHSYEASTNLSKELWHATSNFNFCDENWISNILLHVFQSL